MKKTTIQTMRAVEGGQTWDCRCGKRFTDSIFNCLLGGSALTRWANHWKKCWSNPKNT